MLRKLPLVAMALLLLWLLGWAIPTTTPQEDEASLRPNPEPTLEAAVLPPILPSLDLERSVVEEEPSAPPPATFPTEIPRQEPGQIHGRVLDGHELPVHGARVLVYRGRRHLETLEVLGTTGAFACSLEGGHAYRLAIDPTSLRGGLSPPLLRPIPKGLESGPNDLDHLAFAYIPLAPGQVQQVDLHARRLATASGRFTDESGHGIPGVRIQLRSWGGQNSSYAIHVSTTDQGSFHFPEIYPGAFRLTMDLGTATSPEGPSLSAPIPIDVTIQGGQHHDFGEIVVEQGPGRISGRIVDQDGEAFPGLRILCYANAPVEEGVPEHDWSSAVAHARTDAEGGFQLQGLPLVPLKLALTPDFTPGQAKGPGHAAIWAEPVFVDLREQGPTSHVGTHVVEESRPFLVHGHLVFDPTWLAESEHRKKDVRVLLEPAQGETLPEGTRRNPLPPTRLRVDPDTNEYRYSIETPMTGVVLSIRLQGHKDLQWILTPEAHQESYRQILIPSDLETRSTR